MQRDPMSRAGSVSPVAQRGGMAAVVFTARRCLPPLDVIMGRRQAAKQMVHRAMSGAGYG